MLVGAFCCRGTLLLWVVMTSHTYTHTHIHTTHWQHPQVAGRGHKEEEEWEKRRDERDVCVLSIAVCVCVCLARKSPAMIHPSSWMLVTASVAVTMCCVASLSLCGEAPPQAYARFPSQFPVLVCDGVFAESPCAAHGLHHEAVGPDLLPVAQGAWPPSSCIAWLSMTSTPRQRLTPLASLWEQGTFSNAPTAGVRCTSRRPSQVSSPPPPPLNQRQVSTGTNMSKSGHTHTHTHGQRPPTNRDRRPQGHDDESKSR